MNRSLDKLFNSKAEGSREEHHVRLSGEPEATFSREEIEQATEDVLQLLLDHAADVALGPAAAYSVNPYRIEIDFTVEADTSAELYKKLGKVAAILEKRGPLTPSDTQTSRLHRPTRDLKAPVPA